MSFDDKLGARLRDERDHLAIPADPAATLDALRPGMRRARRLRRLTQAGAAVLLVAGGATLARLGATVDDGSMQIVPAGGDDPIPPLAPAATALPVDVEAATTSTTTAPLGEQSDHHAIAGEVARPTPTDDDPPTSSVGITGSVTAPTPSADDGSGSPEAGTARDDDAPVTTVAVATDDPPAADDDPEDGHTDEGDGPEADHGPHDDDDGAGDDHDDVPSTTTPAEPTSPPAASRFDSECGYVLATVSDGVATIVEIVPAAGYRAKVEDPDHGSITVHFEGGGEDCELKIP